MTDQNDLSIEKSYVDLRTTLIRYLRRMGSSNSEELADETITRVLKSKNAGEPIRNLRAYCLAVSRNVYLESVRQPATLPIGIIASPGSTDDAEIVDRCLTSCMKTLTKEERQIMKAYYLGQGRSLIDSRRRLGEKLGMTMNALRIEAHRIRKRLGECVANCADLERER